MAQPGTRDSLSHGVLDDEAGLAGFDADSTAGELLSSSPDRRPGAASAADDNSSKAENGKEKAVGSSAKGRAWKNLMAVAHSDSDPSEAPGGDKEKGGERLSLMQRVARFKERLPLWLRMQVTFYRIHFLAFFVVMMIGTLIIYASPNGKDGRLAFIDCMYSATSALCVTGLISVVMADLSTFDKVVLMCLMILGSQVFTSLVPVYVRKYYFKKYLKQEGFRDDDSAVESMLAEDRMRELADVDMAGLDGSVREDVAAGRSASMRSQGAPRANRESALAQAEGLSTPLNPRECEGTGEIQEATPGKRTPVESTLQNRMAVMDAEAVASRRGSLHKVPSSNNPRSFQADAEDLAERATATWAGDTAQINSRRLKALVEASRKAPQATPLHKDLSWAHNSEGESMNVATLLPGQRRLIELKALELLSWLVPVYFLGFQIGCFILLYICLLANPFYLSILQDNGVDAVFQAAFQSVSAFNNAGLSLFDNNLMYFQAYLPYLLIVMALILLGNTMYAPTLRFLLFAIARWGRPEQRFVSRYLLDHPRRCYTHLFPPSDTRWLVVTVLLFNGVEFFFFCVLDWTSPALDGLPADVKILDGLFQSVSTRNAGFNVIAIGLLSAAMLVLYAGMMYIAVYPVYITRQRSREQREVYDDEDLKIFYEDLEEGVMDKGVLGQGKRMLSRDSALLFLSVFLICIIQRQQIMADPLNYSVFNIVFEVISAYGNVGLSLGYTCPPDQADCVPVPYSFSGVWNAGAKFVIILVMFLGRHRGLPDNIDAAIIIPDQKRFRRTKAPSHNGEDHVLVSMASIVSQPTPRASLHRRSISTAPKSPFQLAPQAGPSPGDSVPARSAQ